MKNNGNKTVIEKYFKPGTTELFKELYPDITTGRGYGNKAYESIGAIFVRKHADMIPDSALIIPVNGREKEGILEQIGRMQYQDGGYAENSIIEAANKAAELLKSGKKSKDVEHYLRQVRLNGRF